MFKLFVVSALLAVVAADVSHLFNKQPSRHVASPYQQPAAQHHGHVQGHIGILKQHYDITPEGNYQYGYETENGIAHEEAATIQHTGPELAIKSAHGSYSYTSPEGEHIQVSYVADQNGFQPQGSHLPVAPPVPQDIQKAIAYVLARQQPSAGQRHY